MYWSELKAKYYVTEKIYGGASIQYWNTGRELLLKAQQRAVLDPAKLRRRPGIPSVVKYLGTGLESMTVQRECGYHHTINCCHAGRHTVTS